MFSIVYDPQVTRTVIVGDIHGCYAELSELLDVVGLTSEDTLVLVGDLVARGPDTSAVLRLARELGARCVRGNHEQRLLDARSARSTGTVAPRLGPQHLELLRTLEEQDWAQLEMMPLWLDLPRHDARVVHAGVRAGLSIDEQEPWTLLHLRSIRDDGSSSQHLDGVSWPTHYRQGPHVIFGHNSRLRLQLYPLATGIDTGCVYGGTLTAMVLAEGEAVPPVTGRHDVLRSVPAARRYYRGSAPSSSPRRLGASAP